MKVISLWSGGKDSCFACYRAMFLGYEVSALVNFIQQGAENSLSHGLSSEIILKQAQQTEIPIVQKVMPNNKTYRDEFKVLINDWKKKSNIEGVVFGDIYLQEHKDWIDKVCEETKVKAIFPIWRKDTPNLIEEIIDAGFKSIVVSVKKDVLGKEWLGRKVDREFIKDLNKIKDTDLCGEKGEYHTFVYDAPIFKKPVEFTLGEKILEDGHWFLKLNI